MSLGSKSAKSTALAKFAENASFAIQGKAVAEGLDAAYAKVKQMNTNNSLSLASGISYQ